MMTLRRTRERYDDRRGRQAVWRTFYAQAADDPLSEGFGNLAMLNEIRLPPGETIPGQTSRDAEIVTYVRDGALAYEDSLGRAGIMQAGEFRRMSAARGVRSSETNASTTDWTHLFQIGLRPNPGQPAEEQRRFSVAERRDGLCLVAAPDARAGSLRIRDDALIYSALLVSGQHQVHHLPEGRRAWLHMVSGELTLDDVVLTSGDGVGISAERSVSFTALAETEILLLDVAAGGSMP